MFTHAFDREWRAFDLIFKAHFNRRVVHMPANVRPWAFGATKRVITAASGGSRWADRTNVLLANFRVKHELRQTALAAMPFLLKDVFVIDSSTDGFVPPVNPAELFEWERTGGRHNLAYYQKLKRSKAVSCFGGRYAHRLAYPVLLRKAMTHIERILPRAVKTLYQWDSFRLWETFAAECLVFHMDLEQEGCVLPVMPQNGIHYMGIDLTNLEKARQQILDLRPNFSQIAKNGREWALANYSPLAVARRFLTELGYEQ